MPRTSRASQLTLGSDAFSLPCSLLTMLPALILGAIERLPMQAAFGYREVNFRPLVAEADVQNEQLFVPVLAPWAVAPGSGISGTQPCPGPHLG